MRRVEQDRRTGDWVVRTEPDRLTWSTTSEVGKRTRIHISRYAPYEAAVEAARAQGLLGDGEEF